MSFQAQRGNRVSRSGYWLAMLFNVVACLALLLGGLFAVISGDFVIGILMMLAIIPVGIYFRVVMMRRCRDIGWPPALPWIMFAAGIFANAMSFGSADGAASAFTGFGFATGIGLVDFGIMIAIGCIKSKSETNYQDVFGPEAGEARRPAPIAAGGDYAPLAEDDKAGWDAAIERALKKQATGGTVVDTSRSHPAPAAPVGARPQAAGFGRKGL